MSTISLTHRRVAVSRHGFGFWAVAFAFAATLAYSAIPTPLYGIYQRRDGFSSFMITVIFGVYAVGVVVSLFTVGHLSDWYGRRRLVVPALATSIASAVSFLLWRDFAGLLVARVVSGLAVGAITATATAWLAELHAADRPSASARRPQIVSTAANLGGIGLGPLVAGVLAQWVRSPLTVPYLVSLGALVLALALVIATPETRERATTRRPYRPQRVSIPMDAMARYLAATVSAAILFAAFGLFTSLAPTFLAVTLHHPSHALAGAAAFVVFGSAAVAQLAIASRPAREVLAPGIAVMVGGLALVVTAVWLSNPSLALFLIGGALTGAGAGLLFKSAVGIVAEIAPPERRAEALAGMFLAGYLGLSLPVMGLGALTQFLAPTTSLLIFSAVLVLGILIASPVLFDRPREPSTAAAI